MPSRMLLSPQFQQRGRHLGQHRLSAVHLGMIPRTQRDHQVYERLSGYAVMHDDRSLVSSRSSAAPANVSISFENPLSKTAEVLLILPLKGVASSAEAVGENLLPPTSAVQRSLSSLLHTASAQDAASASFSPALLLCKGSRSSN